MNHHHVDEDPKANAARRLVQGIIGNDQSEQEIQRTTALALRILQSSIGSNISQYHRHRARAADSTDNNNHSTNDDEAMAWRRIEQRIKKRSKNTNSTTLSSEEVLQRCQSLYYQEIQPSSTTFDDDNNHDTRPIQMLVILSHLLCSKDLYQHSQIKKTSHNNQLLSHLSAETTSQQRQQQQTKPQQQAPIDISRPIYQNDNAELVLLQECFYCLQGISGDLLYFSDDNATMTAAITNSMLHLNRQRAPQYILSWLFGSDSSSYGGGSCGSSGAMDALRICGEAGFLCQRIQSFIDSILSPPSTQREPSSSSSLSSYQKTTMKTSTTKRAGAVAKALAVALQEHLQEYYICIAQLESNMLSCSSSLTQQEKEITIPTLRWLYAELQQPTRTLYTLALITDGLLPPGCCSTLVAVDVLTCLYRHSRHGDTRHATLAQGLLTAAAQPWWDMLYAWTTMGLLQDDLNQEFFIACSSSSCHSRGSLQHSITTITVPNDDRLLWHFGYHLEEGKIPEGMIDASLLVLALNVGKGINFIRKCLGDTEWTLRWDSLTTTTSHSAADMDTTMDATSGAIADMTDNMPQQQQQHQLGFYHRPQKSSTLSGSLNVPILHHALRSASEQVHSHILHVLIEEHHIFHHLWALKQFLLLGQGDFVSSLIEALQQAELEQNVLTSSAAKSVDHSQWSRVFQKQTLMTAVDGALKSSNAKDLPHYVLERLQVQVIDSSSSAVLSDETNEKKEDVENDKIDENDDNKLKGKKPPSSNDSIDPVGGGMWDGFLLEYVVPDQLMSIVHPEAMTYYRLVFQFLFGLKAVEFRLDATWRQSAAIQHALQIHCQNNAIRLVNNVGYSQATILLRNISITRQAMIHLVRNLKTYVMLDVLEGGWKDLVHRIEAATTLDHVIEAHDVYLQGIVRKCWLLRTDSRSHAKQSNTILARNSNNNNSDDIDELAKRQWKKLLRLINEFCTYQEEVFSESLQAAEIAFEARREADKRLDGQWVFQQEAAEEETFFFLADTSKLLEVIRMSDEFHQGVIALLASLHKKINTSGDYVEEDYCDEKEILKGADYADSQNDLDSLRFLTFQLDCNNYYGSITAP